MTKKTKPLTAEQAIKFEGIVQRATEIVEAVRIELKKVADAQEEQAEAEGRMKSVLDFCLKTAQEFPDERRKPIVKDTGNLIGNMAAGIIYAGVRKQHNAAMVLAETLFVLGYETAMKEPDPKFSNLE